VTCFQQLIVDAAIPLGQLKLCIQILQRLLLLQCLLLPDMCPHYRVEVAVGFGASSHGGRRRAIELAGSIFYGLFNGFCALDVSLALLSQESSIMLDLQGRAKG
jgi:hypothetical protein